MDKVHEAWAMRPFLGQMGNVHATWVVMPVSGQLGKVQAMALVEARVLQANLVEGGTAMFLA